MAERGTAALELALGLLVLLVPVTMLVLAFGASLEARALARSLAADVATTLVVFDGVVPADHLERLTGTTRAAGIDPGRVRVDGCGWRGFPLDGLPACVLRRGEVVEVSVVVGLDRPLVGGPISVRAASRVRVPDHRSTP